MSTPQMRFSRRTLTHAGGLSMLAGFNLTGCFGMKAAQVAPPTQPLSLAEELAAICHDPRKTLASMSVLAVKAGQVAYSAGFGTANFHPTTPVSAQADTLYRAASISKLITALGVMRLVEQGVLELDLDVSTYLGWRLRNPHFPENGITLRMLLTHTSSLRDDAGYFWPEGNTLRSVLEPGGALHGRGAMWARQHAPGRFFQYANLPWGLIGSVMESATGQRFDALMQAQVFVPLGIEATFNPANLSPQALGRLATLYRKRSDVGGKEVWNAAGPWVAQVDDYSREAPVPRAGPSYQPGTNGTLFGPQGNVRISALGLGTVMRMLLQNGRVPDTASVFLKAETVELMLRRHWTHEPGNGDDFDGFMRAWGLGNQHFLDASEVKGQRARGDRLVASGGYTALGHFGIAWGLTSAFVLNPTDRSGMVFMVGGTSFNPETEDPGRFSSMFGYEENILTALHRLVLLKK